MGLSSSRTGAINPAVWNDHDHELPSHVVPAHLGKFQYRLIHGWEKMSNTSREDMTDSSLARPNQRVIL